MSVNEAGTTSDTFTVRLASQPTSTVTVAVASNDSTEGTATPVTLTFTTAVYDTPQTVTVQAVNDAIDDGDITYNVVLDPDSSDGAYSALANRTVSATTIDDDTRGVTVSPTTVSATEGGAPGSFTIVLNSQPTVDVTIPLSSDAQCTLSESSLTFTPADWSVAQTVTVTAFDDAVAEGAHDCAITAGSVTGGDYAGATVAGVTANITDNDTAGLVLSQTSSTVNEAGTTSDTFTVRLNSEPTKSVTVAVSSDDTTEGTITTPATLTFTAADWNTPQNVTLQAVNDDLDDGDIPYDVALNPASASDAIYNALVDATVSATTVDDDTAGLVLSQTTTTVSEAGTTSDTFTVRLNSEPTADVTVEVTSGDTTEGTITTTATLTFTAADWNTPQNVTLQAVNDDLDDGDIPYDVALNPASASDAIYNALVDATVSATTVDDDTAGLALSKITASVNEAGTTSDTFTVRLDSEPTESVTVAVSSGDITEGTITTPATLTFTAADWNTPQNVTLQAVNDDLDDGDVSYDVVLDPASSDSIYDALADSTVSATTVDDDTAGLVLSETNASVNEAGTTSDTFTVKLNSEPTESVTVEVTSGDTTEGTITTPATLTFTAADWNTPQNVTLQAVNDDLDDGDASYDVVLDPDSSDSIYAALANSTVSATTVDDDTLGVTVTPTTVSATEGGATGSFTVVLASEPTADVTIPLSSDAQCTLSESSLTFTPADWSVAQTVTVTAFDDAVAEGAHDCAITAGSVTGGDYAGATVAGVTANITDNDTAGLVLSQTSSTVNEAGTTSDTFTVRLNSEPTESVTVAVSSDDTTEGTITTPATLTFTAADWNTPQDVTLQAVNDDLDDGDIGYDVVLAPDSSDSIYNALTDSTVSATTVDDDTLGVTVTPTTVSATEGGAEGSFTVVLTSEPTANVTVPFSPDAQCTLSANPSFTPANWSVAQTVTVTAFDDAVAEGAHDCTITAGSVTGGDYAGATVANVTANITDNDTASVNVTDSPVAVTEGGATGSFNVVLTSEPTADVTITLGPDAQCTLSASSLTFNSANWSSIQSVTVTAVDDPTVEGPHDCTITGNASGDGYSGVTIANVTANVTDNDTAGVSLTESGGSTAITEGGAEDSFTIVLTAQPTADVTISLGADAQCTLSPSGPLTFTAANWDSAQSVTVTAVDDALVEGAHNCAITTGDANGGGYIDAPVPDVTANVTDNDTAGVTMAGSPVEITEGGAPGDFTVVLTSELAEDVTILLSSDAAQCTLSTSGLTFTAANWNSAQSVTVTAVDDDADEGMHTCAITTGNASSVDSNYNGQTVADVTANVTDDDPASGQGTDESVVQKTFESQTYNFMAARMKLLARFGPRNYRLVDRSDGQFQMGSNGFNIQGADGDLAGNFALNSGAVRRIINGEFLNVTPTNDIPAPGSRFNAWIEGQFAYYKSGSDDDDDDEGSTDGNFFVGYAGADVRVFDGLVVGVMGQFDWYDEDTDTGKTDGNGWMVGPYFSAELGANLFLDARGMYGQSDNSSTQDIEGFEFDGDFDTDRLLVEVILSGRFDYGRTVLTPDLKFIYIWEDQQDYSVTDGNTVVDVDGQLVKLGQLSTGLKVAQKMDFDGTGMLPYVGGRLFWDFDNPGELEIDGSTASGDDIRAAISLGFDMSTESTQISIEATYDGLFADDYESIGGRLSLSHQF